MKHLMLAGLLALASLGSAQTIQTQAKTPDVTPMIECGPGCDGGDGSLISYSFNFSYIQSSNGQKREVCSWTRTVTSTTGTSSSPYATTGAWVPSYYFSVPGCRQP